MAVGAARHGDRQHIELEIEDKTLHSSRSVRLARLQEIEDKVLDRSPSQARKHRVPTVPGSIAPQPPEAWKPQPPRQVLCHSPFGAVRRCRRGDSCLQRCCRRPTRTPVAVAVQPGSPSGGWARRPFGALFRFGACPTKPTTTPPRLPPRRPAAALQVGGRVHHRTPLPRPRPSSPRSERTAPHCTALHHTTPHHTSPTRRHVLTHRSLRLRTVRHGPPATARQTRTRSPSRR